MDSKPNYRDSIQVLEFAQHEQHRHFHNLTRIGRLLVTKKYSKDNAEMLKQARHYFEKGALLRARDIEDSVMSRLLKAFAQPKEPMHVEVLRLRQELNDMDEIYVRVGGLAGQLMDRIIQVGSDDPERLHPLLKTYRETVRHAWNAATEMMAREKTELFTLCAELFNGTALAGIGKEMAGRRGHSFA